MAAKHSLKVEGERGRLWPVGVVGREGGNVCVSCVCVCVCVCVQCLVVIVCLSVCLSGPGVAGSDKMF